MTASKDATRPAAGDSAEQRAAELLMIGMLGARLGIKLDKRRFPLPAGGWLEVDGVSDSPPVLCEAWAHVGPAKSAQKHKVMTDAVKLIFAAKFMPPEVQKICSSAIQKH